MAGTVTKSKEDEDEKTFDDINNKKSDHQGRKDRNSDNETDWGSTKGEERLLRPRVHNQQARNLMISNGMNSASLSSLHLAYSSAIEGGESSGSSVQRKKVLKCHDYVVLFSSFFAVMICTGLIGSMSVFYVEFMYAFPESKTKVALVPSLANGIYDIGGVVAGLMIDTIGCRWSMFIGSFLTCIPILCSFMCNELVGFIILLGIISAFGSSIVMLIGMVRVGQTFGTEHQFGSIFITGAHPSGFIVFPQIMPYIIHAYGWRGALFILSGITLQILPFGFLATNTIGERTAIAPAEGGEGGGGDEGGGEEGGENQRNKSCLKKCPLDVELLASPKFQFFAISSAINWGSTYMVHLLIVDFAVARNYDLVDGASLLTCVGVAALVSRVFTTFLRKIKCKNIIWYVFFSIAAGVVHACIPLAPSYNALVAQILGIGCLFGCRFSFFILTLLEMVPVRKYSQALGYCLSLWGIAVSSTGSIVGELNKVQNGYDFSYATGGLAGAVCLIPLAVYLYRSRGRFDLNFPSTSQSEIEIRS